MTATTTSEYLLLFRDDWHHGLPPQVVADVSARWMDWFRRLCDQGQAIGGKSLERTGRRVSRRNGRTVADGPFAESKEMIGGYFLLSVRDLDEALAIAGECPGLEHGAVVEVRECAPECPLGQNARRQAAARGANA